MAIIIDTSGTTDLFDLPSSDEIYAYGPYRTTIHMLDDGLSDTVDGGAIFDTIDYSSFSTAIHIDLTTGNGNYIDTLVGIDSVIGTNSNDYIWGNEGSNTIYGNGSVDHLFGEAGSDFIFGGDDKDYLYGGEGNDYIEGGDGTDYVNGDEGSDYMAGGNGDDVYSVDSVDDVVSELNGSGIDKIECLCDFNLESANVLGEIENLYLMASVITAIGNSLDNRIEGNWENNILDGRAGADTMIGGDGNDTYFVDNAGDTVFEASGTGIDRVFSSIDFDLGGPFATGIVEDLTLTGIANISGIGNAFDNVITGNSGNNVLNGLEGFDTLIGGLGNDTYDLGNGADLVIDVGGTGDVAITSIGRSMLVGGLGSIEHMNLVGTGNMVGNRLGNFLRGSGSANTLDGGIGNDTLYGMSGHDILIGGHGRDTLIGGLGNDIFRFASRLQSPRGSGADTVTDFDDYGNDRIDLRSVYGGKLAYIHDAQFTGAGQVRINDVAGSAVIVEVNTGGSLAADMQIRLTGTSLRSMTASDFYL